MLKSRILILGLILGLSSCSSDTSKPQAAPRVQPQALPRVQPQQPPRTSPAQPSGAKYHAQGAVNDAPAPPKGAQYTIYCGRIEGPMHVERANRVKNELIASTGMPDWYVVHENGQSLLYYGYYKAINDPEQPGETQRAQTDRRRIDLMTDPMGNRPFREALFVELAAPDPQAPPEWNLANAKGYWSLQIAAYKDSPDRKQAAVDAVREARAQGVEAYYYHGPTVSSVCIGAWPMHAVKAQEKGSARTQDPDRAMMVLSAGLPREFARAAAALAGKQNIEVLEPRVEIVDPSMRATIQQYPTHAINGLVHTRMINGVSQPDPSFLVVIPNQGRDSVLSARPASGAGSPALPYDTTFAPSADRPPVAHEPARQGQGRLRSFDR
ncbi:hypothetical protein [Fontivita pretiosa]|uniref:hypothetical protein n=1 Tax=Fontivita pretiosa TaxID=2989684 RepID=UPI003D1632F9